MYMVYVNVQTLERNKSNRFQSFGGCFICLFKQLELTLKKKIRTPCIPPWKDNCEPQDEQLARIGEWGGGYMTPPWTSVKIGVCTEMVDSAGLWGLLSYWGGRKALSRGRTDELFEAISRLICILLYYSSKQRDHGVNYCPEMQMLMPQITALLWLICTFVFSDET